MLNQSKDFLLGYVSFDRNNLDLVVSELLTYYKHGIKMSDICSPATRQFSVIHRLAFGGLVTGLELAVEYWGKGILHCKNADGFTPLYMSTVFQYESVAIYIMSHDIDLKAPREKAETYLYFKLRHRYFFSRDENRHIKCIMTYAKQYQTTTYRPIKAYNCARKVVRIIKRKDLLERLRAFKRDLAFFIEKSTWNKIIEKISKFIQSKSVISGKSIVNMRNIQIFEAERRTCNYLRISFKKMLLKLQKRVTNSFIHSTLKEKSLDELNYILAGFDRHEWNTTTCFHIGECHVRRALIDVSKHMQYTLRLLRSYLLNRAITDNVFLHPLGKQRLTFHEILKNPSLWLRLYHHYDYMNELQNSTAYKGSTFYRTKKEKSS